MKTPPSLSDVKRSVLMAERARLSLSRLSHLSLPLPVASAEGLLWGVWFVATEKNEETGGVRIGAPAYGVFFRADYGAFAELRATSPSDFGVADSAGPWLGEATDLAAREGKRPRFFELLQTVAPAFAAGPAALTEPTKQAAAELKTLLADVAEPPLLPCYKHASKRFFSWLTAATA